MVPTVGLPPATPFTCQATVVVAAFLTIAVKGIVAPPTTAPADEGEIEMATGSGGAVVPPEPPPQPATSAFATNAAKNQWNAGCADDGKEPYAAREPRRIGQTCNSADQSMLSAPQANSC